MPFCLIEISFPDIDLTNRLGFSSRPTGKDQTFLGWLDFPWFTIPRKRRWPEIDLFPIEKMVIFPIAKVSLLESFPALFRLFGQLFETEGFHWIIWDPRCSAVDWRWAPLENPGQNGKIWDDLLWILSEFDHIKNDDNDTGNIHKNNNRNHVEIYVDEIWNIFHQPRDSQEMPCFFLLLLFQQNPRDFWEIRRSPTGPHRQTLSKQILSPPSRWGPKSPSPSGKDGAISTTSHMLEISTKRFKEIKGICEGGMRHRYFKDSVFWEPKN